MAMTPSTSRSRWLSALTVIATGACVGGWEYASLAHWPDNYFLPRHDGAEWILARRPATRFAHPRLPMTTIFRQRFTVEGEPGSVTLVLRAFREATVVFNGKEVVGAPFHASNWKDPIALDLTPLARRGVNTIAIAVTNHDAPPALWAEVKGARERTSSDETWSASLAGGAEQAAILASRDANDAVAATQPEDADWQNQPDYRLSQSIGPRRVARERGWLLVLFLALTVAVSLFLIKSPARTVSIWRLNLPFADAAVFLGLAFVWIGMFLNNLVCVSPALGYDATGHLEYIEAIQKTWRLPLAHEGWEMYQPPLYYLVSAILLSLTLLSPLHAAGVAALRFLGLALGLGTLAAVAASLSTVFPERRIARWMGLVFAGALPAWIYTCQYPTNEVMAAALSAVAMAWAIRLADDPAPLARSFACLGLILGLAMLSKATALLVAVAIIGSLAGQSLYRSPWDVKAWRDRIILPACVFLLTCGWHYARVYFTYGYTWAANIHVHLPSWQDPGLRMAEDFLRFGAILDRSFDVPFRSFWDSLHGSLWGDAGFGGSGSAYFRPPWNYDLMALGFWLALVPSIVLAVGLVVTLYRLVCEPTTVAFIVMGTITGFALLLFAAAHKAPYFSMLKGMYLTPALVPLAIVFGRGADSLARLGKAVAAPLTLAVGLWAFVALATFWIWPTRTQTQLMIAQSRLFAGDRQAARRTLDTLAKADPSSSGARFQQGALWELANLPDEAIAAQRAALAIDPTHAGAHAALARLLANRNPTEAIGHATIAMNLAPFDVEAIRALAGIRVKQGKKNEVVRVLREGILRDPYHAPLRRAFAQALREVGRPVDADEQDNIATRIEQFTPGKPEYREALRQWLSP